MPKKIKVALIPDETRIIINYGLNDDKDLKTGRTIEIFEPDIKIKDPDTNEVIGKFDFVKATLTITEVNDGYSIARNRQGGRTYTMNIPRISSPMSGLDYTDEPITYEEINIDTTMALNELSEYNTIKIGDSVRFK